MCSKIGIFAALLCSSVERLPVSSQEIARTAYRYESLAIVNLFVFVVNYVCSRFDWSFCGDHSRGRMAKNCEFNERGTILWFVFDAKVQL